MAKYNKLWAALILGAAFVALHYFDMVPAGLDEVVVSAIQGALTAAGVYQVANA